MTIDMSDKTSTQSASPADRPLFGLLPDGTPLQVPVIGICGPKGAGKTLLGLSLCPEETIEIGVEDSGVTYNLPLKKRYSMYKEVTGKDNGIPKPIECWEWFAGIVDKIAKGELKCRVLFIDPISDIQSGLVEWVRANADKFGRSQAQYEKASGLLWSDVKSHAKMLLGKLSSKCTLIFTVHMGSVWSGGAPVTGKTKAKGIDTFYELASLYVYLTREIDPKTGTQPEKPIGHVCPPHGKSRLAHMVLNSKTGDWEAKAILPPRIEPFTWARLRDYVQTPPNYDKLKVSERAEIERLSDDDKMLLEAETARTKLETEQLRMELAEKAEKAAGRVGASVKTSAVSRAMGESPKTAATATASPKASPAKEATATGNAAKPPETKPADTEPLIRFPETLKSWTKEDCLSIVKEQIAEAGMTPEQIAQSCKKRGCETLDDMADDKLEEFRKALWGVLTKKEMERRSKAAATKK